MKDKHRNPRLIFGIHCSPIIVCCFIIGLIVGEKGFMYLFWCFSPLFLSIVLWGFIYEGFYNRKRKSYWVLTFVLNISFILAVAIL